MPDMMTKTIALFLLALTIATVAAVASRAAVSTVDAAVSPRNAAIAAALGEK